MEEFRGDNSGLRILASQPKKSKNNPKEIFRYYVLFKECQVNRRLKGNQ
jgi:hypothetical protein